MANWDSYRHDLDTLRSELENLLKKKKEIEAKNDVMRRIQIAEKEEDQQPMKPTTEVQLWLSSVEAVETEVDELIKQASEEIDRLHPGSFSSRTFNMSSSYEFKDMVADKLQAVTNLINEGAVLLADEGALEVSVSETIPEDEADDQWPIVGMESIINEVWRCLKKEDEEGGGGGDEEEEEEEEDVGIIGVYGMGGVGKTTLLEQIKKKLRQMKNDFNAVIWVVVPRDLQLDKIQEQIGEQIDLFDDKAWKHKNFEDKASDIFKILKEKKFVLLMDDLWERVDLTKVGVPLRSPENSSKIVFTTRSLQICSLMEADMQFKVTCLSNDVAWELFQALVGDETLQSHPEVLDLAEDVSRECCGLPLALVSIGQAMASKKTPQEWSDVLEVLTRSMTSYSGSDDQLKKDIRYNLKLSYDDLQNDLFKSCFLYCCLFPRNSEINKRELIDYWIGEGFLDERLGEQSQGHYIIDVLLSVCLLEQSGEDDDSVKMHNWIHDMSLWIASKIEMEKGNCFFCTDLTCNLTEAQVTEYLVKATRMSLLNYDFVENLSDAPKCPNLQTLFLIRNSPKVIRNDFFFQFMPSFKVLNLSDNMFLAKLPSGISNLISLQHLDLSGCTGIQELPKELRALKKLKCLNLERTAELHTIPRQLISEFSVLHVLRLLECRFMRQSNEDSVVCNDAQLLIEELLCLKNLSMLSISLDNSHALQRLLSSNRLQSCIQSLGLRHLSHPKSIKVPLTDLKHLNKLEISNCEYLEELEVDFVGEAQDVRESPCSFYFLHEVIISKCRNLRELTWLILAPNLKHLEISYCDEMEEIINVGKLSECPELMGNVIPFSKLEFLTLRNLPKLRSIYWTDLPFPDLKEPNIRQCPALMFPPRLLKIPVRLESSVPSGIFTNLPRSGTMRKNHVGHPHHELVLKRFKKPYTCDGCKEPGIGSRYRCEYCNYDLHKHCMFYKSTTRHDFFPNSTFNFLLRPQGKRERCCYGCGKLVRGFVYYCKEEGWDLHPCCMNLPYNLKVADVKFKLRDKVLKKCFWCNRRRLEGSISRIRGWSYVSMCEKYHFHVYCASEMMLDGWKNECYNYNDQTAPDSLALALELLPIQGRSRGRGSGSSGDKFTRTVNMFFNVFADILLGDPTITLTCLVEELIR